MYYKHQSKINQAAREYSANAFGYEKRDAIYLFKVGAEWAIDYCDQVIRRVLEHYEHGGTIDCIMSDFDEIISDETDLILSTHGS